MSACAIDDVEFGASLFAGWVVEESTPRPLRDTHAIRRSFVEPAPEVESRFEEDHERWDGMS